jgi:hypothetical protein
VSALLAHAGIDVAMAKGVAAEARWYDRLGERPSSDLDLVLSPAHVDRIDDAIALLEPSHPLCGRAAAYARRGIVPSVDVVYEGVPIDLHVDALKLGVRSRNRDAIWERTLAFATPSGASVRVLDAESSLLLFLVHLNKDRFYRLLGFTDVARVHERDTVDRGVVAALAAADGISTSVELSWNVVVDTLGLDAPRARERAGARRAVWNLAWAPPTRLLGGEGKMRFRHRQWLIALLARGRTLEAAVAWVRTTFPPREVVTYAHSAYAPRWGGAPVADAPRSYLVALTAGRVRAVMGRRRAVMQERRARRGGSQAGDTARRRRTA